MYRTIGKPKMLKRTHNLLNCKRCYNQRDDLNEFQICNSCRKKLEQMTPDDFKSNFKFEKCKCGIQKDYLNEFNECISCEKCKRCNTQRRDYLNDFQFCNSCCKQMERMTPSGFKPNFEFKKCRCNQTRDYLNEFNECISCEKCKRCNEQKKDYLNEFPICNSCCKQMEQMAPSGFEHDYCKKCWSRNNYLNEYNECNSCEKCKKCNDQKRDYLNEFQFCNSCCKQIVRMTPAGFKPNFKFEICKKCYYRRDYLNEFQICNSCYKQMEQMMPAGFKHNFKFEKCKGCYDQKNYLNEFNECDSCEKCKRCNNQRKDYLNGFQICNPCCKQIEQKTPINFKPNFKFKSCKRCYGKRDYLNEFQICNSCCKQMKQMLPGGFKPNFKFESCKRCYLKRDHLNEFQICNSCCKQMNQITPSGLKPNFKFESCKRCYHKKDYLDEYLICNSCRKQMDQIISSGNKVIDDFIRHTLINNIRQMEFVPYKKFNEIEFIAEGGFSKIYRATWIDCSLIWNKEKKEIDHNGEMSHMTVALKELNNSKNINSKELNELKIYHDLILNGMNSFINKYYGITQEPISQNFMIIMKYYDLGDLTHYITKDFFYLNWFKKLEILDHIIIGLINIHNANIIHKDYHSGNIFVTRDFEIKAVTGDLGISKSAIIDDNNEIYGIVPYVAPEIFQGQKYTKASDIYGFGMIMWELMTGRRPFWDQSHDTDLIIKICDGFRPLIITNAPKGYIELMQECWHPDPSKRPRANDIYMKIIKIKNNEYESIHSTKIIESPGIGPVKANNPGAVYKSRPLSAMIKSAESTRSLKSQIIISEIDKRKFDNCHDNRDTKKIKLIENKNNGYLSKELGFDINININKSKNDEYISKEINFDI